MRPQKVDAFKRKWIIRLFKDGNKTIKQIAFISGFSQTTISNIITKHIKYKQDENNKTKRIHNIGE